MLVRIKGDGMKNFNSPEWPQDTTHSLLETVESILSRAVGVFSLYVPKHYRRERARQIMVGRRRGQTRNPNQQSNRSTRRDSQVPPADESTVTQPLSPTPALELSPSTSSSRRRHPRSAEDPESSPVACGSPKKRVRIVEPPEMRMGVIADESLAGQPAPVPERQCDEAITNIRRQAEEIGTGAVLPISQRYDAEVLRTIMQTLQEYGLHDSSRALQRESGIAMENDLIKSIREYIFAGEWTGALNAVEAILQSAHDVEEKETGSEAAQLLIHEQRFCELCREGQSGEALSVLQRDVAPLSRGCPDRLHRMAALLVCPTTTAVIHMMPNLKDIHQARNILVSRLHQLLDPHTSVPPRQIHRLFRHALDHQAHASLFANVTRAQEAIQASLLRPPSYSPRLIPQKCTHVLREHKDEVWHVQFSPCGKYLLSASSDHRISVYRTAGFATSPVSSHVERHSTSPVVVYSAHSGPIHTVSWSPNSKFILSGSSDATARVWNFAHFVQSAEDRASSSLGRINLNTLAESSLTPANDVDTCMSALRGHEGTIVSCVWEANSKHCLTSGQDKTIIRWNAITGTMLKKFACEARACELAIIQLAKFPSSPDDSEDTAIPYADVDNLPNGARANAGRLATADVRGKAPLHPASASQRSNGQLANGDAATSASQEYDDGHSDADDVLLIADSMKRIQAYDLRRIRTASAMTNSFEDAALSLDRFRRPEFDVQESDHIASLTVHRAIEPGSSTTAPNSVRIALNLNCAERIGEIHVWEISNEKPLSRLTPPSSSHNPSNPIALPSRSGQDINASIIVPPQRSQSLMVVGNPSVDVAEDSDDDVDLTARECIVSPTEPCETSDGGEDTRMGIDGDGALVNKDTPESSAQYFQPSSSMTFTPPVLEARLTGHKQSKFVIRSCIGGGQGRYLVSGSEDSGVYIWHVASQRLLAELRGHTGTVNSVAWNPANPYMIASASDDHTVRVWQSLSLP